MPRLRFLVSTRCLMAMVAMVAVVLGWAIARPYPSVFVDSGNTRVYWSDGSCTTAVPGPNPIKIRGNSWLEIVDWPDGSTGYYLILR